MPSTTPDESFLATRRNASAITMFVPTTHCKRCAGFLFRSDQRSVSTTPAAGELMLQRLLSAKNLIACVLAAATGITLYFRAPFPENNFFMELIFLLSRRVFLGLEYSYYAFLYTTPYILYSVLLSGFYIFALKFKRRIRPGTLPPYPALSQRETPSLVIGEIHNPRKAVPAQNPQWLTIPERGLFTGIAIFGAVGTGKTSGAIYPFAEQLLGYKAHDKDKRIGGLVLEVKGDFCHKVHSILARHGREQDYVEISLDSDYRYNPLHNELDAHALAYSIASLLNNLFGRGKEPFWQQAYTNLVKFIILLHKVAYDYVTLFDVYECAISPEVLERKIHDAERRLEGRHFVLVTPQNWMKHVTELKLFDFAFEESIGMYRAESTPALRSFLASNSVASECLVRQAWIRLMLIGRSNSLQSKDGFLTTGKESNRNYAHPSSREFPFFSPCSMTARPSNAPSVRRASVTTKKPTRTFASESLFPPSAGLLNVVRCALSTSLSRSTQG